MANKDEKIMLDAKKFAELVLQGSTRDTGEDDTKYIKRQLRLYLESLVLADNFNDLEETRFDIAKSEQRDEILSKIIERRY